MSGRWTRSYGAETSFGDTIENTFCTRLGSTRDVRQRDKRSMLVGERATRRAGDLSSGGAPRFDARCCSSEERAWGRGGGRGAGGGVLVYWLPQVILPLTTHRFRGGEPGGGLGAGGIIMSCMAVVLRTVDPRTPAMVGWSMSDVPRPGRQCLPKREAP